MFKWIKKLFSSSKNELKEEVRVVECSGEVVKPYDYASALIELATNLKAMINSGCMKEYQVALNCISEVRNLGIIIKDTNVVPGFTQDFLSFRCDELTKFVKIWRSRHCTTSCKVFNDWITNYKL